VSLNGPVVMTLNGSAEGLVQGDGLAVGEYSVRIDAPNHYLRVATVAVAARETTQLALTLTPRTGASRAELRGTEVRLSGSVKFAAGSGDINPTLAPAIADLADLLLRNPQIARVRIEGPIDAGGDAMVALTRALSIKQRLIDAGVDANRINAIGGTTKTLKVAVE
jgi:outer membrane protein OmpA-like peptidoglycan-associated protein